MKKLALLFALLSFTLPAYADGVGAFRREAARAGGGGASALGDLDDTTITGPITRGDLLIADASGAFVDVALGAAGTVLYSDGTDAAWSAAPTLTSVTFDGAFTDPVLSADPGFPSMLGVSTPLHVGTDYTDFTTYKAISASNGIFVASDAVTNGLENVASGLLATYHVTSGTPVPGFGVSMLRGILEDDAGNFDDEAGRLTAAWSNPADDSEESYMGLWVSVASTITEEVRLSGTLLEIADNALAGGASLGSADAWIERSAAGVWDVNASLGGGGDGELDAATLLATDALYLDGKTSGDIRLEHNDTPELVVRRGDDSDYAGVRVGNRLRMYTGSSGLLDASDLFNHVILAGDWEVKFGSGTTTATPDLFFGRSAAGVAYLGATTGTADGELDAATLLASTAVVVGAKTTAGIRLDLEGGVLAVREGNDSGYASLSVGTANAGTGFVVLSGGAIKHAVSNNNGHEMSRDMPIAWRDSTTAVDGGTSKIQGSKQDLSDGSATDVFDLTLATEEFGSGTLIVEIAATDGTDTQAMCQTIEWTAQNNSGTVTVDMTVVSETVTTSSGTLTCTWAGVDGTGKATIQATATSSLTTSSFTVNWRSVYSNIPNSNLTPA